VIDGACGGSTLVNSFSLVAYLPEPLAGVVDRLRREFAPECLARAHVTVLPPRPLECLAAETWIELRSQLQQFQPFLVELGEVSVFPVSNAIYLSIGTGRRELEQIHWAANSGRLGFAEDFHYCPHVTLAQDLNLDEIDRCLERAKRAWSEYRGPRTFPLDQLVFVQNTVENRWIDLTMFPLQSPVPV
jgi:2'-5' RNA ligase